MQIAVDRIKQAIDKNEKVMILGDYDVDGTTSVSLIISYLNDNDQFHGILLQLPLPKHLNEKDILKILDGSGYENAYYGF